MIFEKEQFEKYCFDRPYKDTINIHLTDFNIFVVVYQKILGLSINDTKNWLKGRKVLEAGCAMGHVMEDLQRNGVRCWGYEPSYYAIAHAIESVKNNIIEGDHDNILPLFGDNSYDIVFSNSLQYSFNESDILRWTKEIYRICTHSLFFVGVTTQGLYRSVSGSDIWKLQIVKPTHWWEKLFYNAGFRKPEWINDVMCVCVK